MGYLANRGYLENGVDLAMKKVRQMPAEAYRKFVWQVFLRILRQTPQWSGKAVANWNISVGAPNFNYDDSLGDEVEAAGGRGGRPEAHVKGDPRWIGVAARRNKPIIKTIRGTDKVFISNGVVGDDGQQGRTAYLQDLQDPTHWAQKLRLLNQPYEIAQESVIVVARHFAQNGFFPPKISGESWDDK